ncbi:hypothetical protein ABCR94_34145 [Streptomyces sp. 21So2-11]|uniref:hypothetical protein n=1 Tax=Streptomyces sp. 21So2-11 TaxID=3144408 RepID=UPI00321B3A28
MTSTIDDLLADAAVPTASATAFDVGDALRRLAADAAQSAPPRDVARAAQACERLTLVSRWILNGPGAAAHVDRIANDPAAAPPVTEEQLDEEGAAVFACLLYLTEHRESAQFWWQLAAGAGHRLAAYCLHLHHLALGENKEAQHWRHQVTHPTPHSEGETAPPDEAFLIGLEAFARYARDCGCSPAGPPTGSLAREVDRLAEQGEPCIIVSRPDRRLADLLHNVTRR